MLPQVIGTMFKDRQKLAEEVSKIPGNICARCVSGLLRDLSDQLANCTIKQRPALFYDPLANKMVSSLTAEHMQLTEIWKTQQKLQFSDYEIPQLLQNVFSTIQRYQAPLASFAKAANAYNLYQLRIAPNMVVVKRYAQ